jgi:hypothetical protein
MMGCADGLLRYLVATTALAVVDEIVRPEIFVAATSVLVV